MAEKEKNQAPVEEAADKITNENNLNEEDPTLQSEATGSEGEAKGKPEKGRDKDKKTKEPGELEKLQDDYAALNDKYLRIVAEYDNFRKRSARERDGIYPEATAAAAAAFVGVADNFERALATECGDENYKKGTQLTYQSLMEAFKKLNVEAFGECGDKFDPNCHNAVMHVEDAENEAETIVEVFQKGYRMGDRIIRHAMVKVAN